MLIFKSIQIASLRSIESIIYSCTKMCAHIYWSVHTVHFCLRGYLDANRS